MVEMVFVLPVLLLLLFGIAEFGLLFGRLQVVTNAAREAARHAILYRPVCNGPQVQESAEDVARDYVGVLGIDPDSPDLNVDVVGMCDAGNTTVTVNLVHRFEVLSRLSGVLDSTIPLVGRAVMRNENS